MATIPSIMTIVVVEFQARQQKTRLSLKANISKMHIELNFLPCIGS